MAMNSINTNVGAMVALQNLNATNTDLTTTQNRISTGLKINSAKDNGAVWAIAQNSRADVSALDAVKDSIQRGQSTVDVAMAAGQTISDLLNQMKTKALAAADTSLDTNSRTAMANDFVALRNQISKTISNASFNGTNLLKTGATSLYSLADATGTQKLTVQAKVMGLTSGAVGGIIVFTVGATFASSGAASALAIQISSSITNVNAAVAQLGTGSQALQTHLDFLGKLQDTMTAGIGNLVDADMAKESANLQALQSKQQLGIQALSIANSSKGTLLSLFR
ncbi:MAG TPA: flagellin [Caulobacteraceae bacterium]|nr:flagellin [Caulobacteraceae bacterium]